MAPGLAEARSRRPNHWTNASSSRRLGALIGMRTPSPQWVSTCRRRRAHCSWSTAHGAALIEAKLPHSTREEVRYGEVAENISDIDPPSDQPKIVARGGSAASMT